MRDPAATAKPCPICGKPAEQKFRPFCSQRCKDVDLHRWLAGAYAIQSSVDEEDADAGDAPEPR